MQRISVPLFWRQRIDRWCELDHRFRGVPHPLKMRVELRALEANCAASYFRSWVGMPIKWRGASRRPIPDNWHSIGVRSSPYHLGGNRNAAHPVNAILNYAYAALESEIRIKPISDGYDQTIGIMHEASDGSSKFIFDLMELERPRIDHAALDFIKGRFSIRPILSFAATAFAD